MTNGRVTQHILRPLAKNQFRVCGGDRWGETGSNYFTGKGEFQNKGWLFRKSIS
jgi:hypothetical protein